jgi:DNA-binding transcriptional LysR family regulator
MDGFNLLKTFLEVANVGSFSRAAGKLGISKASASKHVATLEARFNVRLMNRSTRSVTLTDAGKLLHGLVQTDFPSLLSEFLTLYPDVHIDLQIGNRVVDLVEEGVDIALRFGRIDDENLIVRRLQRVELILCATPSYWARRGIPQTIDDMRQHDVLTYSLSGGAPHIPFEVDGEPYNLPIYGRMDANDSSTLVAAALAGIGAVCVPALLAQPYTERGSLVPVLKEFMPRDIWLYAAYTQRRHNSAALRALLKLLETRMGGDAPNHPT